MVLIDLCTNVWLYLFCHKHSIPMSEESLETVIYYVSELMVKFINHTCKIYLSHKHCLNHGRYTDHRVET